MRINTNSTQHSGIFNPEPENINTKVEIKEPGTIIIHPQCLRRTYNLRR